MRTTSHASADPSPGHGTAAEAVLETRGPTRDLITACTLDGPDPVVRAGSGPAR